MIDILIEHEMFKKIFATKTLRREEKMRQKAEV